MPNPNLVCEVRTDGGKFTNWLTVAVSQSFSEPNWNRHFRLTCAEPSEKLLQRLVPGSRVDIALAGKVVVERGYIKSRQAAYDANRHAVQVDGYSQAGLITNVSIDTSQQTGQYRGYTLEQIANGVLKPHGLKFRLDKPPEGANHPFPQVMVRHGESPFELVQRLCRQRGIWLSADADGTLVGSGGGTNKGIVFQEGVNILSASCQIEMPEVDKIITTGQQPGSDSLFGSRASNVGANIATSGGVPGNKRVILAEMPIDQKGAQLRATMEAQAIEASLLNVTLTYPGWLHPGGDLWGMREFVTVKSPMLFPIKGGEMELRLWGYTYGQTPEGQTTTTIELVNRAAFAERFPNARESDNFFNRQVQSANPEAA